jgi:hypothetical protein
MEPNYEILCNGSWLSVNEWIFRSWSGQRRMDGKMFEGPVFYLGSKKVAVAPGARP